MGRSRKALGLKLDSKSGLKSRRSWPDDRAACVEKGKSSRDRAKKCVSGTLLVFEEVDKHVFLCSPLANDSCGPLSSIAWLFGDDPRLRVCNGSA